jgi:single-strand DNA-binding protein
MASFNQVTLMGNLTRSPELRYTPNGTPVATIGLAVNRKYKQGDQLKEEVGFFDIVAFGRMAETVAQYVDKGDCMLFNGRLQQRRWETDDGQKRSKVEIVAQSMTFIKTKQRPDSQGAAHPEEESHAHADSNPYE